MVRVNAEGQWKQGGRHQAHGPMLRAALAFVIGALAVFNLVVLPLRDSQDKILQR
jgi:hypothetical protein